MHGYCPRSCFVVLWFPTVSTQRKGPVALRPRRERGAVAQSEQGGACWRGLSVREPAAGRRAGCRLFREGRLGCPPASRALAAEDTGHSRKPRPAFRAAPPVSGRPWQPTWPAGSVGSTLPVTKRGRGGSQGSCRLPAVSPAFCEITGDTPTQNGLEHTPRLTEGLSLSSRIIEGFYFITFDY